MWKEKQIKPEARQPRRGSELGLFGLRKRRHRRVLSICLNTWWKGVEVTEPDPLCCADRTEGSGHKVGHGKLHLNIRKSLLLWGCSNTGGGCPKRLRTPHLWMYSELKRRQLGNLLYSWSCFEQGTWAGQPLETSSCHNQPVCSLRRIKTEFCVLVIHPQYKLHR